MQRDRACMSFIQMLMNFKCVGLVVEPADERPIESRQNSAGNVDHRPVNLGDRAYRCEILNHGISAFGYPSII
jgi:hypothetical protein